MKNQNLEQIDKWIEAIKSYRKLDNRLKSIEYSKLLITYYPRKHLGYVSFAEDLIFLNEFDDAREIIEKGLKQLPNQINLLIIASDVYRKLKNIEKSLYTAEIPDPDILIRTGDTKRLSNFMLWQLAYSEIYFEKKLWPDFKKKDFLKIIQRFKKTKRNYGNI